MALMVNRDAPYSGLSSLMAMQGRYGDTELVHMSKPEIQGLASLGQLTINPDTGLPEAFSLKSLLPVIGGIAGSILLPGAGTALGAGLGASAVGAGLGTAAGGLLAGQKPGEALLGGLTSGLMSYGIGSLLGSTGVEQALKPVETALPTGVAESSIPATTQGLAGQAGQAYGGFDALSGVGEFGGFGYDVLPPAGSMVGVKDVAPKTILGFETAPAVAKGQVYAPSELMKMGVTPSTATTLDIAKQKLTDPLTYAPLGAAALTGGLDKPYEAPEPEARKPIETDFGKVELVGGDVRRPIPTEEEFRRRAVEGGSERYFDPYRYVRTAAEGGIVGLQQGGMATPQAPSAMSAMLTPPVQQPQPIQPINIAVQPPQQQPQQPQPMTPMGQGPAPLPDQQKEFMKLMDMEEQVQGQKQAAALQGTSALANLLSSAEGMMQQYPQTSPSGQAVQPPSPPPMTYGSQVNLGLASGGTVNAFGGGFMKIIADMVQQIKDKQSRGEDIKIPFSGGRGMNQLLSRGVYSNTSSPATSTQSLGGAASMNQLLARPVYSRQAAEGGIVEYNQGGMPSQGQPYFEGQVEGPGDGQSDEVAFRVDGGQVDGAMLSPDEYVLAADVVSAIGNGSSDAGAAKLDQFMKNVRQDAYGTTKQMQPFNNQGLTNLVA